MMTRGSALTMNQLMRIVSWKMTKSHRCPICGGHLTEHGFQGWFTCDKQDCKFNT